MEKLSTMTQAEEGGSTRWKRFILPVAIVFLLLLAWQTGLLENFSLSAFVRHREWLASVVDEHFVAALSVFFLLYCGLVAISFPGASLLTVFSGFLFGGVLGGAVTVLAATTGATMLFLIARSSLGGLLERKAGGFMGRLAEGFRRDAFSYLLSLRLTPVFPFWVINIAPALMNMRLAPYVLATFLGIIPGTFAYAWVGSGLGSVIEAQERADPGCAAAGTCSVDPASLVTPQMLLAMGGLGLVALLPVLMRRLGFSPRRK